MRGEGHPTNQLASDEGSGRGTRSSFSRGMVGVAPLPALAHPALSLSLALFHTLSHMSILSFHRPLITFEFQPCVVLQPPNTIVFFSLKYFTSSDFKTK